MPRQNLMGLLALDPADCYLIGSGVPQDYAQAAHWFGLSAEAGYPLPTRAMLS